MHAVPAMNINFASLPLPPAIQTKTNSKKKKYKNDLPRSVKKLPLINTLSEIPRSIITEYIGQNVPFRDSESNDYIWKFQDSLEFDTMMKTLYVVRNRYIYLSNPDRVNITDKKLIKDFLWCFMFKIFQHHYLQWDHSEYNFDEDCITELVDRFIVGKSMFNNTYTCRHIMNLVHFLNKWIDKIYIKRNKNLLKDTFLKQLDRFEKKDYAYQLLLLDDSELFWRCFTNLPGWYYKAGAVTKKSLISKIENIFHTKKIYMYYNLPEGIKYDINRLFGVYEDDIQYWYYTIPSYKRLL